MSTLKDAVREQLIERLEKLRPQKVRENLLFHRYNPLEKPTVEAWLKEKEEEPKKEQLKLDREANSIARSAKNAAWFAIGIAILSLIVSVIAIVIGQIKWIQNN